MECGLDLLICCFKFVTRVKEAIDTAIDMANQCFFVAAQRGFCALNVGYGLIFAKMVEEA